jgi:hypothetical protein
MDEGGEPTPRRPSPTSRARRIGGRPTPRPTPPEAATESAEKGDKADKADRADRADRGVQLGKEPTPAPAAEPAEERDEPASRATRSGGGLPVRWVPAGVLGLAVLALLVILVVAGHGVYWAKPDDSAGAKMARQEQVLAAAKKCFAQINSYDYRKLDGLMTKDLACTTGTFTSDLRKTLDTQIVPLAPKLKATQTAQVNKAGVALVSRSGNQVVTLIYGQLAQTNATTAKQSPRIDVVGAVVTVDKVGDQWLISKIDTDVGNSLGS